ncbi:MAG: hypothetical protein J0L82_19185 [Deltaproteobacteria bacterium]|nr:hypothetical protein [Deltaproteobacteria bacterium]
MKNTQFSLFQAFSVLVTSIAIASVVFATPAGSATPSSPSATTDEICVESAATSIIQYLQAEEPTAKIAIVRDSLGTLVGLTDENGIYNDLDFSDIFRDEPNTHIYEFRDGDYIVFATVTMFAPNGALACTVTDVDSGQDDQD